MEGVKRSSQKRNASGCRLTSNQYWNLLRPSDSRKGLALAQSDRTVTGVDGQRLAAAVHLAVNLRVAESPFHSDGNAQANVAVPGAGVNIGLEIGREHEVNAAITRANRPARSHLGTWQNAGVHAAVARLDVERIETAGHADMAIARVGFDLAIQVAGLDGAISRAEAHVAFEVLHGNAAIVGVEVNRAIQRVGFHRPNAGMYVYGSIDGYSLYGSDVGMPIEL